MRIPIRLRLAAAATAAMAVVLVALAAFVYTRVGTELLATIDFGLRSRAQAIEAGLARKDPVVAAPGSLIDPDEAFAQVIDPEAADPIVDTSAGLKGTPLVDPSTLGSTGGATFLSTGVPVLEDPVRLLIVPVTTDRGRLFVVVGATLSDRQEALDRLIAEFSIGAPIALLLTGIIGWFVAGAALRPVERMRVEAAAISAAEPGRRLAVPETRDELARLAGTLNTMLADLNAALERERRFVDDAAHELRTPLAVLRGELELALSRPRSAKELEDMVRRASAEAERLSALAEDLLVLARTQDGRLPVHRTIAQLDEVIGAAIVAAQRHAAELGVQLEVEASHDPVRLDAARIRQAVENLLDNAVRYAGPGGHVRLTAFSDGGMVTISVSDSGPGFADPTRAFDPFVRDPASPGAGLGLSIARAVAEGHGGSAVVENGSKPGGHVILTVPA